MGNHLKNKLQEILDRANQATPGPWKYLGKGYEEKIYSGDVIVFGWPKEPGKAVISGSEGIDIGPNDLAFILSARVWMPKFCKLLMAAIEMAEKYRAVDSSRGYSWEAKEFLKLCEEELGAK